MSSNSIAFAEWFKTLSAARTLVEAGVLGSTMTFSSVDACRAGRLLEPGDRLPVDDEARFPLPSKRRSGMLAGLIEREEGSRLTW